MKKIHDYLITGGASLVIALSILLAHAQAPELPAPAEPEGAVPVAPEALPAVALPEPGAARAAAEPALPLPGGAAVEPVLPLPGGAAAEPALPLPGGAAVEPVLPLPGGAAAGSSAASRLRTLPSSARMSGAAAAAPPLNSLRTIRPSAARDPAADAVDGSTEPGAASEGAAGGGEGGVKPPPGLKFNSTAVDIVLMAYAEETGKTLLMAPDVPKANITLNSQPGVVLSRDEFVEAIEVVLSMHGIVLEPFGDKFVKVLARKTVRTDGIKIVMESPEGGHPEKSKVVSQMIRPKYIAIEEAKAAIDGFKKPDGMIQTFERTNSLLVTDTQENVNRMLEIIEFIDQPIDVTEDVHVVAINFAKADDIKKRIEELVAESQKVTAKDKIVSKESGAPGIVKTPVTATSSIADRLARLRSPQPQPEVSTPNEALDTLINDADRGMIRGKVQIIADERTNKLIIITNKDNMAFFERIINVLDVETAPDVKVEVMRLEYADAEEVSTMLNDLIGNATAKKEDGNNPAGKAAPTDAASRSTSLAEAAAARASAVSPTAEPGKTKLGQLSKESIKILADKRTNALVMMGSIGDLAAITEIVKSMDIMLSQVLIETVVLEVALKDEIETGINWVQRISDGDNFRYTVGGGNTTGSGVANLFGTQEVTVPGTGVDADGNPNPDTTKTVDNMANQYLEAMSSPVSGLEYFMTLDNLNLDAVIKAAASDTRSRILSSPILLTVDNKEATIEATETRYMYKGMRYMGYSGSTGGGSYEPDIEQRDVGLTVKVTPRISPNGNVILTVEETFEQVLGEQIINGQAWPTVTSRKLSADVSVNNGATVVLGGLVQNAKSNSESGIPYLKDIPYIGKYLFGSTKKSEARSEMLVFLTPYVIKDDEDMRKEARRRKDYLDATDVWTKGWSDSDLADPVSAAEMETRLERKQAMEKRWQEYGQALEASNEVDGRISEEREKVIQLMRGDGSETNRVPPASGLMKVEGGGTGGVDADGRPLPEDESVEPQRPAVEEKKTSWLKKIFS